MRAPRPDKIHGVGHRIFDQGKQAMTKDSVESVGMDAARLQRIGPVMQAYVDRGIYAGVSTIVARRGVVVHEGRYGFREREAGLPMTEDTIFRLYSMTKPIVCTALMTLFEEGRFRLIDPVACHVPSLAGLKVLQADGVLADPKRPVMLRDLMAHTSGLSYHFLEDTPVGRLYSDGKLIDPKVSPRQGDRRSGALSARVRAGLAMALQRRHRCRRARDRGDLGADSRRFPSRTPARTSRHGRYGVLGP
jgi:CubicO group peptidase (beta-lactamase class C family)